MNTRPTRVLGTLEFVALTATMMAMLAVSIDVVLPALAAIGSDLKVENSNHAQFVVSYLILGMAVGQVLYGPVADAFGRRPSILVGLAIFAVGCVTSIAASDFRIMLLGRFLQGLGAAGPRVVTLALVRDQYSGSEMARIMSLVVAVLMIGPLFAPFIGQGILLVATWRFLFVALLIFDLAILAWLYTRQPETLPAENRTPLSPRSVHSALREVLHSRVSVGYAVAAGFVFGELFAYVNSARQIYQDLYGVGAWFPFYFSLSGIAIASAALLNSHLVRTFGMRSLCLRAGITKSVIGALFLATSHFYAGLPPLAMTLGLIAAFFFCVGILFGNLNALAMEPLGHIAGVASGVVGSLSWLLAVVLGTVIGQQFNGSVTPLATGLATISIALVFAIRWAEVDDVALV